MKSIELIKSVIEEQNPWWKEYSVPNSFTHSKTERFLAQNLWEYILSSNRLKRYLVILGPRRVGKTTLMYQTVQHLLDNKISPEKIQWIRLDHPLLMTVNLGLLVKEAIKFSKASENQPLYLFLDELVYAEHWDKWLKTFYDEHWPVHIIASSSAASALQKGRESGVGRWEELYLNPYLLLEFIHLYKEETPFAVQKKNQALHDTITDIAQSFPHTQFSFKHERKMLTSFGGFPEFLFLMKQIKIGQEQLSDDNEAHRKSKKILGNLSSLYFHKAQQMLRSDAIERAIYKDIPQSYRVDSPLNLERLFYVLAGQITGLLSLKEISQDIPQASIQTLDRYLNYLIQTYLIFTLSNYDSNERNIQRRQRKVYFVDVAIRNSALQRDQIFEDSTDLGKVQENLAASHLYHLGRQSGIRLYHWKRGKFEVDFIYDDPVKPLAFEVGSTDKHSQLGLKKFLQENPKFQKSCYYVAPDLQFQSVEESPSGIGRIPLDLFLIAIGLQYKKSLSKFLKKTSSSSAASKV